MSLSMEKGDAMGQYTEEETPLAEAMRERRRLHRRLARLAERDRTAKRTPGPWRIEVQKSRALAITSDDCIPYVGIATVHKGGRPDTAENDAALIADAPTLLDALEEMWRFADNLADGAPDASPSHQRANELAGKYRDLLKKHGRTPWEDR